MNDNLRNVGMHGGAVPQIFNRARLLRKKMTQPEIKLWDFLKTKPLGFKISRQHPFDMYILDFFCVKARLSIEIDGINHQRKSQKIQDKFRTEVIEEYSIHELRFMNKEVIDEFEHVKQQIISVLESLN